jgi:Zn finger protein HypA/HybF involved in hydrogenase expression
MANDWKPLNQSINQSVVGAGLRQVVWTILILSVLGTAGGFIFKALSFLFVLFVILPVVGFLGLQWWLRSQLVTGACPVCHHEFSGLAGQVAECPSCGEALQIVTDGFKRAVQDGVIDIQAVEVKTSIVED